MEPATDVESPASTPRAPAPREARVRPEHAGRYPGIRPGRWEPAATVADRVLAGWLLRAHPIGLGGRILKDAHFEFRGGTGRGMERGGARPRREDR